MKHETHIPAKQAEAQKNIWLPRPHENSRRKEGHQTPPRSRPKKACSLSVKKTGGFSFPKEFRLTKRRQFLKLQAQGERFVGSFFCMDYRVSTLSKLGITASVRYGNAPERNRFKRLVREAFRKNRPLFPFPCELHILARQRSKKASEKDIQAEMIRLLQTAQQAPLCSTPNNTKLSTR